MKNRSFSLIKFLIGWPFSILAFVFILKLIIPQAPSLLLSIGKINISLLADGIFSFLAYQTLRSYIWQRLLRDQSHLISFRESAYLFSISELKRYIPGNIWSFLGRTVAFSNKNVKKSDIAKSLIIEAELLILGSALISLMSLPFLATYFFPQLSLYLQLFISGIFILICGFLIFNRHILFNFPRKFEPFLKFILPNFKPSENAFLIFLSIICNFFFGLGYFLTIFALFPLNGHLFLQLSGFFSLSFLIGYLSLLTPSGFGVREAVLILGLSRFMTSTFAAFVSLFTRVIFIFSEVFFILITYLLTKAKESYIEK